MLRIKGKAKEKVEVRAMENPRSDVLANATIVESRGIGQGSVKRGLLRKVDRDRNRLVPNAMVQDLARGKLSAA